MPLLKPVAMFSLSDNGPVEDSVRIVAHTRERHRYTDHEY